MERKQVIRIIQWAFETDGPQQAEIRSFTETLSQKERDILNGRVLCRMNWSRMQEEYFYSERRMRDILNTTLDNIGKKLERRPPRYA